MRHILLVDDNDDLAKNLKLVLEMEGYVVHVATSGVEALRLADADVPALIIADVIMAGGDGFALLKGIRDSHLCADVPFVFVSARTDEAHRGLELGANDYLTKPFAIEDLLAIVNRHLRTA